MQIHKSARLWAAPVIVLAALGLLAGCGGGGGNGGNPIATPSPTASAATQVTARLATSGTDSRVEIAWPAPSFVSISDVVEYHIYRNGTIIGTASRQTFLFVDTGAMPAFSYYAVSANDDTRLSTTNGSATPAFTAGASYTYRVTALYVTPESSSAATPVYSETEIGRDTITQ